MNRWRTYLFALGLVVLGLAVLGPYQIIAQSASELDKRFRQARQLMEEQEYAQARNHLKAVHNNHSNPAMRADAAYLLFETATLTGREAESLPYLEWIVDNTPDHPLAEPAEEELEVLREELSDQEKSGEQQTKSDTTEESGGDEPSEEAQTGPDQPAVEPSPGPSQVDTAPADMATKPPTNRIPEPGMRVPNSGSSESENQGESSQQQESENSNRIRPGNPGWGSSQNQGRPAVESASDLLEVVQNNEELLREDPETLRELVKWTQSLHEETKPSVPEDPEKLIKWADDRLEKSPEQVAEELEARRDTFQSMGKSQTLARYYYLLGQTFDELGRQDEAFLEYLKASSANPEGQLADNISSELDG